MTTNLNPLVAGSNPAGPSSNDVNQQLVTKQTKYINNRLMFHVSWYMRRS